MNASKIELYFLKNLLQIALLGITIILASDIILTHYDFSSIAMDLVILAAVLASFISLRSRKFKMAVVIITAVPLITMYYHAFTFQDNTVPMTVILTIGFTYSILLKGRVMLIMHTITLVGLLCVFGFQAQNPESFMKTNVNEVVALAITFIILYILVVSSAGTLKSRYDKITGELKLANRELIEKSAEIEAQNEELVQSQDKLNDLNQFLEQTVEERTKRIFEQNEQIVKYTYVNAHHVRGPIARLLGLIHLSKIDPTMDSAFLIAKIEKEAEEIDSIISGINSELEKISE